MHRSNAATNLHPNTQGNMEGQSTRSQCPPVATKPVFGPASNRAALGSIGAINSNVQVNPRQRDDFKSKGLKTSHNGSNIQNECKALPKTRSLTSLNNRTNFNIFLDEECDEKENFATEEIAHEREIEAREDICDDSLRILEELETSINPSPECEPFISPCRPILGRTNEPCLYEGDQSVMNFVEYSDDILAYLLSLERKFKVDPSYMAKQPEVNNKMRCILVDWMVEVSDEYNLHEETLFLAITMIDRYVLQKCSTWCTWSH